MKFIYVDESGARDQGDVFVMAGLMVDAYKLRKKTEDFDQRLEAYYAELVAILEPARETLGRCPESRCVKFYNAAKHPEWKP